MTTWRSTVAGLAVVATSVGLAACGGSDSDNSDALSRSAIVSKANAICKKAQTQGEAVEAPTSFADASVAAKYFDQVAPITDTETKALLALEPDDDVKGDYTAFTKAQSDANALLQTIKRKADSKDSSGLDDLKKVEPAASKVSATAKKLGATACG